MSKTLVLRFRREGSDPIGMRVDLDELTARQRAAEGRAIILRSSGRDGDLELEFNDGRKGANNYD